MLAATKVNARVLSTPSIVAVIVTFWVVDVPTVRTLKGAEPTPVPGRISKVVGTTVVSVGLSVDIVTIKSRDLGAVVETLPTSVAPPTTLVLSKLIPQLLAGRVN